MTDKALVCKDCGNEFVWTVGEQEFYAQKRLSEPKRCKPCRQKNRERKERQRER